MKSTLALAVVVAVVLAPAAFATHAPPPNEKGLISHQTTCYGGPFGDYPGQQVWMTPLAMGSIFWINVDGVDLHYRVQSSTVTYFSDPTHPETYSYGQKIGLIDETITCYGSFADYSVVSRDVLIR